MFKNRKDAGLQLASKIKKCTVGKRDQKQMMVVALPRGGVPVAREIAEKLQTDLTILVAKKIAAPFQKELALGAVTSSGVTVLNEELRVSVDGIDRYVAIERKPVMDAAVELEKRWRSEAGIADRNNIKNKAVVLVDDGVATGMTTLAALRCLAASGARELILATPVIAKSAWKLLHPECTEIISLKNPKDFNAVSDFYEDFHQVEDDEMICCLKDLHSFALDKVESA